MLDSNDSGRDRINYLTGASNKYVRAVAHEYGIGLLVTPDTGYRRQIGLYPSWAADNGAFSAKGSFSIERWWSWLERLAGSLTADERASCLYATAPDVLTWHPATKADGTPKLVTRGKRKGQQDVFCIGHAAPTVELAREWLPRIKALGLPAAMVAQDGLEDLLDEVPWDQLDVVFLGGSTEWKTGLGAKMVVKRALYEGKRVHMGRVNSGVRLALANSWGCHTADGTYLAFGPEKNLPNLLGWLDALTPPCAPADAVGPVAPSGAPTGHTGAPQGNVEALALIDLTDRAELLWFLPTRQVFSVTDTGHLVPVTWRQAPPAAEELN